MREMAERLLLTVWIGSMWTVGYLVAPTLFSILDDRVLAGSIAGRLFTITSYLGLSCGGLLLLDLVVEHGKTVLQQWRGALLTGMLLIICIGQFVLQPKMAALREAGLDGVNATIFARLHGTASLLFLMNSLGGLALVLFGLRAPAATAT